MSYPPQGHPPQGHPPQGHPPQGYPPQGHPPQGYPPQGYPPQGYPPQGYPPQGYPPQGYPPQGYPPPGYPPAGYGYPGPGGAPPPGWGRPGAPKAFGVLSIVFGSLMSVFTGLMVTVGTLAVTKSGGPRSEEDVPALVLFGLLALASVVLIALGAGQVRYRKWARLATVIWSVAAILLVVAEMVGFILLAKEDHEATLGLVFLTVLLLPYPVLLLVFFTRPRVAAAMTE